MNDAKFVEDLAYNNERQPATFELTYLKPAQLVDHPSAGSQEFQTLREIFSDIAHMVARLSR